MFVAEGVLLTDTNEKSAKRKFFLKTKFFFVLRKSFFYVAEVNAKPETNEKSVNLELRYPRKMSDVQDIQKKFNDILDSKASSKPLEDVVEEIENLPMLPDPIKAEENMFESKQKSLKNDKDWRSFFLLLRLF